MTKTMTENLSLHLINNNIVLFDGVCNLCNAWVDFLLKFDKNKTFYFSSLQSEVAQKLLKKMEYQGPELASILFIQNYKVYDQSTAVLKILKTLGFPWSILYPLFLIPKPLRDFIYKGVAKNRYRFFGQRETCRLPTEEEKSRFI